MNIKRVGIDLAKQVFQVHGVDGQEKVVLRKQLRRAQMPDYFKKLPPCLIGIRWQCFIIRQLAQSPCITKWQT
jgi:transposase